MCTIEDAFKIIMQEKLGPDGYVKLKGVTFPHSGDPEFVITGCFGRDNGEEIEWEEAFSLHCEASKASYEFLQGMFYKIVQERLHL